MKHSIRKIAIALLAVMIFSALAGYAYAANVSSTTFQGFTVTSQGGSYSAAANAREKTNSSAMVILIDTSSVGSIHNVRAMGSYGTLVNAENCTKYNNAPADHVVCGEGTYYGIKNTIREHGYTYAFPSIMHNAYGTASGKWAPDSSQSYGTPDAP